MHCLHFYLVKHLLFGFYDHGHQDYPGWALRNYIAFLSLRWKIEKVQFLCYRERRGEPDLEKSLIGEASFAAPHGIMIDLNKIFTISLVIVFNISCDYRLGWLWLCAWSYWMGRRKAWGWKERKETERNQSWINEPRKVDEECFTLLCTLSVINWIYFDCLSYAQAGWRTTTDALEAYGMAALPCWFEELIWHSMSSVGCWNSWMWSFSLTHGSYIVYCYVHAPM